LAERKVPGKTQFFLYIYICTTLAQLAQIFQATFFFNPTAPGRGQRGQLGKINEGERGQFMTSIQFCSAKHIIDNNDNISNILSLRDNNISINYL